MVVKVRLDDSSIDMYIYFKERMIDMNNRRNYAVLIMLVTAILMSMAVTAFADNGKIPITAKSQKAIDYFLKGRGLAEKLQFSDAREYYRKAVNEDPDFAIAWSSMAGTEPSGKEFFEDIDTARALKDKVSEGERIQIEIQYALVTGDTKKAEELGKKLTAMFPNDERAQNLMGNTLFGQQRYEDAIVYYNKAVAVNPEFSQPYNQLGYANRFIGNYTEAEIAFRKYIELIPNDPNPYDSYAELLMKMGKHKESIDYYEKALEQNREFAASHLGIASNYNFMNEHKYARRQLKKLLEFAHDNGQRRQAWFGMAVSYADQGDFTRAIESLEKQMEFAAMIEDHNNMAFDCNTIGTVLLETNKPAKAQAMFDRSLDHTLKADVSDAVKDNARRIHLFNSAKAALADLEIDSAKKKAAEFQEKVEALGNPFQIKLAHELFGTIALVEGKFDTALKHFNQANLQNPYNLYRMAIAYKGMGDEDKADEYHDMARNFRAVNNINQSFVRAKNGKLTAASL